MLSDTVLEYFPSNSSKGPNLAHFKISKPDTEI